MIHAAWMMSNEGYSDSKTYAWLREQHSRLMSQRLMGHKDSPESKAKRVATRRKNGGYIVTPEMKEALRKAHTGNTYWKGKEHSPETRKLISKLQQGKKRPQVSEKQRGEGNHFYGKSHSPESKQKMRVAQLGKKFPYKKRKPLTAEQKANKSQDYLQKGYRPPRMFGNQFNKGKIWVSNPLLNANTLIRENDLQEYLNNGFELGRSKIRKKSKAA